jgi:hypothetical protein
MHTLWSRLAPCETDTAVDGSQRWAFAYLTTNRDTSLRTETPYWAR